MSEKELLANIAPFGLRMQSDLKERLKAVAEQNGRSMNAEIVSRLEASFEADLLSKDNEYYRKDQERMRSELTALREAFQTISEYVQKQSPKD